MRKAAVFYYCFTAASLLLCCCCGALRVLRAGVVLYVRNIYEPLYFALLRFTSLYYVVLRAVFTNRRENFFFLIFFCAAAAGRFEIQLHIAPPDAKGRRDILALHLGSESWDVMCNLRCNARTHARKRTYERTHTHTHTHTIYTDARPSLHAWRAHTHAHAAGLKAEGRLAAGTFESAQQAAMSKVSRCIYRTHAIVIRTLTLLRVHNKLRQERSELRGTKYVCVCQAVVSCAAVHI